MFCTRLLQNAVRRSAGCSMRWQSTGAPHSHLPLSADPKFGAGYYSDNTIGCYNVVAEASELVFDALEQAPKPLPGAPYTIADYGTADGGTSMVLLKDCVDRLRAIHGPELPIMVQYEDQPVNDWTSLFMRLKGLIPGVPSFLETPNVFVSTTGVSFYEQCFPPSSIQLGISFTAMHWLTKQPAQGITDATHHSISKNTAEIDAFAAQAAKDWELVLLQRAKELVPGGQMVIVNFTLDEQGQCLGNVQRENGAKRNMYQVKNDIWLEMAEEGIITHDEYTNTSFANYYRNVDEFVAPFAADGAATRAGLRLRSVDTRVVPCPYHSSWMLPDNGGRTAEEHGKWYVPTTRTWSNSTYTNGLDASRAADEKAAIVDELFSRYAALVAEEPEDHGMDYVHCYAVIEKV